MLIIRKKQIKHELQSIYNFINLTYHHRPTISPPHRIDRNLFISCSAWEELVGIAGVLGTSYSGDRKFKYAPLHCITLHC